MIDTVWVAEVPADGKHGDYEICTFDPVETEAEKARYAELGWKWTKFVKSSD